MSHKIGHNDFSDFWGGMNPTSQQNTNRNAIFDVSPTESGDFFDKGSFQNQPQTGFGFNMGTANAISSGLSGLGQLASGWAALKNLKLVEQQMGNQQDQWNKQYAGQATTVNNQIASNNTWRARQGRTDMSDLVPRYNTSIG